MTNEIENLLPSFRASILREALEHRGTDVGLVASYVKRVREHQSRYLAKLDNLRSADDCDQAHALLDQAEAGIAQTANAAILTAETAGRVEIQE